MIRIILAIIALFVWGCCANAQQSPFTTRPDLFDQSNIATLGLSYADGVETISVFRANDTTDRYANNVQMIFFKGYFYCQWQNSKIDEDSPDTWIAYSRSQNGKTWSKPEVMALAKADSFSTPGGWWIHGDSLISFINVCESPVRPHGGTVYYRKSADGFVWTSPRPVLMTDGTHIKGIFEPDHKRLSNGRIISAAHFRPGWLCHPIYTDEPDATTGWKKARYTNMPYRESNNMTREIEPAWFLQDDHTLVMVFRDQDGSNRKLVSYSVDHGLSWSTTVISDMPDGRTRQSAGNLPDGTAFMVGNPVTASRRSPLAVVVSKNGKYFDKAFLLRNGSNELPARRYEGWAKTLGFSYPKSMIHDGYLYVSYSVNKEDVEFTRVPLASLSQICTKGEIDACNKCSGGTTGLVPCSAVIQAEDACRFDGTVDNNNPGFTGQGFVNTSNEAGAGIMWTLNAEAGTNTLIKFTYANGSTTGRPATLKVNGTAVSDLPFSSTGSWTSWQEQAATISVKTGVNIIELIAVSQGGVANMDQLMLMDNKARPGSCEADCYGVTGGSAFTDECGTCVGGNTGKTACVQDCAGTWGGTAPEDACGVCLGVNASYQPCSGSLEAEEACEVLGILLEDRNAGFSGSGYVNTDNVEDAFASWMVHSVEDGNYTLSFRFANGGGDLSRDARVLINGEAKGILRFPPTTTWTNWSIVTTTIDLSSGIHELRLEAVTEGGLANLDILYMSEGLSAAGCLITGLSNEKTGNVNIWPNPASDFVYMSNLGSSWILTDITGREVLSGHGNRIDFRTFPAGIYYLQSDNKSYKIIKSAD